MFRLPLRPCLVSKDRLQVTFSMFGLIFASLSAALIIACAQPLPRTIVQRQVRQAVGNVGESLHETHPSVQVELVTLETRMIRGNNLRLDPPHRRLMTHETTETLHQFDDASFPSGKGELSSTYSVSLCFASSLGLSTLHHDHAFYPLVYLLLTC